MSQEVQWRNMKKLSLVFNQTDDISAIELNISCPNVKEGGIQFGMDPEMAETVTEKVKQVSQCSCIR